VITQKEFPILEFDEDTHACIRPSDLVQPLENMAEKCVLCFFSEAIAKIIAEYPHAIRAHFKTEGIQYPLYELNYNGQKIALMQAAVGAPLAAAQLEELAVTGCKKFLACGMCGALHKELAIGHLIIPIAAVRDEGISYHYAPPSREIIANRRMAQIIEQALLGKKIPYIKAKTWTTDAIYRETPQKIALRKQEGCVAVEMEAAAYMAVAEYNNVEFGQILCAGDSLAFDEWDKRDFYERADIREFVLRLAMDVVLKI